MENSYWIELIAFDKDDIEKTVDDFIDRQRGRVDAIYILMTGWDCCYFYDGLEKEYVLSPNVCSYGGHKYSNERDIQPWTNFNLKKLIDVFHARGVEVYMSLFANAYCKDWDGNIIDEKTLYRASPEVCEFSVRANVNWGSALFIKRFKDGRYLEDEFSERIKRPLVEYGFDGLHIADGMGHPRARLACGDYTDDLVEQFCSRTGVKLPEEYPMVCGANKKLLRSRFKYIINNLRYEWTMFYAERFGEWVSKLVAAVHSVGKKTTMNNCWTCSPFEALFRYGIDYNLLAKSGVDKIMKEDANSNAIQCWYGLEMELSEQSRWNMHYRLMEKQRALKACCPDIPMVNMTSVHDTYEQWDIINNAPNEYRSSVARRSVSFIWRNGELVPSCEGSIFCLSDGVPKYQWDIIHDVVDNFDFGRPVGTVGFTALYDDDIKAQLKEFITTRRPYAGLIHNEFSYYGLPVTAMADGKEILKSVGPLLICTDSVRDETLKNYLENCKDRLIVCAGYKTLDRKPNASFSCGGFSVKIYNAKGSADKRYAGYKKASLYFDDPVRCFYPENPRTDKINPRVYKDAIDFINAEGRIPYLLKPCDLKNPQGKPVYAGNLKKGATNLYLYKMDEKVYRLIAINRENIFNQPIVKLPFKVKDAKTIGKPEWAKPTVEGDDILMFRVNNRSAELLEIVIR